MGRSRLNLTEEERKLRIKAQKKKSDAKRWSEKTEYRERQLVLAKKRREEKRSEISEKARKWRETNKHEMKIARAFNIKIQQARFYLGKVKINLNEHFGR